MTLQFAVRKESHAKVGDAAERWPRKLRTDVVLAAIRGNKEQSVRRLPGRPECQVEQPDDARIDRCCVLHLEGARYAAGAAL